MSAWVPVVFVSGHIEHLWNFTGTTLSGPEPLCIAALPEAPEHFGCGFFCPIRPHQSEASLAHRRREWSAMIQSPIVVGVAPCIGPACSRCRQTIENLTIVCSLFILRREILRGWGAEEVVGDRMARATGRGGAEPELLHDRRLSSPRQRRGERAGEGHQLG